MYVLAFSVQGSFTVTRKHLDGKNIFQELKSTWIGRPYSEKLFHIWHTFFGISLSIYKMGCKYHGPDSVCHWWLYDSKQSLSSEWLPKPKINGWGAYLMNQSRPGCHVLPASLSSDLLQDTEDKRLRYLFNTTVIYHTIHWQWHLLWAQISVCHLRKYKMKKKERNYI